MSEALSFGIQEILNILPHRYPFLLVDRVVELTPPDRIRTYKNLTFNEPFFQGHFPGTPVMPGVLIIEALAQSGVILVAHSHPEFFDKDKNLYLFAGIEKARFRAPVKPGDRLDMECVSVMHKLNMWKIDTKAFVDGNLVADARLTAASVPKEGF
jgi:3-hydroxyacyl-[acyl-carrier-protein] dehydratase